MPQFSLAYCTNVWIHHQAPVCEELVRLLGEDRFKLCLFERPSDEQLKLGYTDVVPDHRWIAGPPSCRADLEQIIQIVCDADVAVLGHCPHEVHAARVATGKLTFIMSERMMRGGFFRLRMLNPRFARGIRSLRATVNRPYVHYLAIGAYAPADARLIGLFGDRIWTWAYFISQGQSGSREGVRSSIRILWAGRFLRLKRVDLILRAMALLGPVVNKCTLELIGDGPTRHANERLAKRLGLENRVCFRDAMAPEAIRQRMAEADIYVFPSNHKEGWGAVVAEAMTEGCVVVASNAAGASKVLIEHDRTGFLFTDGSVQELADLLGALIEDGEKRRQVGLAAATQMNCLWHPRVGAERFVALCQGLRGLMPLPTYQEGPCCRCVPR
jgi:glycosyltransferase involved in cell wall biosynthesis